MSNDSTFDCTCKKHSHFIIPAHMCATYVRDTINQCRRGREEYMQLKNVWFLEKPKAQQVRHSRAESIGQNAPVFFPQFRVSMLMERSKKFSFVFTCKRSIQHRVFVPAHRNARSLTRTTLPYLDVPIRPIFITCVVRMTPILD